MSVTLHIPFSNRLNKTDYKIYDSASGWLDAVSGLVLPHTRASEAMLYDNEGHLWEVPDNVPVLNGARYVENRLPYSNDFSQSDWSKLNVSVAQNGDSDPFGGTDAWEMTDDATNDEHTIRDTFVFPNGEIADRQASAYVKYNGSARYCVLGHRQIGGAIARVAIFDMVDGVFTYTPSIIDNVWVTDEGDGWYRIEAYAQDDTTNFNGHVLGFANGPTNSAANLEYSGTGSTFLFCFAQAEIVKGASKRANEYQATNGARAQAMYTHTLDGQAINPAGFRSQHTATNLLTNSNLFNTGWTKIGGGTYTDGAVPGPDGWLLSASTIVNGSGGIYRNFTLTADVVHTVILVIGPGDHDWTRIILQENPTANGVQAWFNAQTQELGQSSLLGTGASKLDARAIPLANGWTICVLRGQLPSGITAGRVLFQNVTADGGTSTDSTEAQYWGAGLFESYKNSMPIETDGSTVQRVTDVGQTTDLSFLNADRNIGSWYVDTKGPDWIGAGTSSDPGLISVLQSGAQTTQNIQSANEGSQVKVWSSGGASTSFNNAVDMTQGVRYRCAFGFDLNNVNAYGNGVQGSQMPDTTFDTTGTTAQTAFRIGRGATAAPVPWEEEIAEIFYDDERVDDSVLEAWSNGNQLYNPDAGQTHYGMKLGFGNMGRMGA